MHNFRSDIFVSLMFIDREVMLSAQKEITLNFFCLPVSYV
jgi:hypothetical protein